MRTFQSPRITFPFLLALFLCLPAIGASSFPRAQGPINDFAGTLTSADKASLLSRAQGLKDKTGAEIFVAIVPSLNGMTVEEYANKLFTKWGPGEKGKDNGVLVVVCPSQRKVRVEVGYGLEGVITDGRAGDVIREDFLPAFKRGNYGEGILKGVDHLARFVETPAQSGKEEDDDSLNPSFQMIAIIGLCLFTLLGSLFLGIGLGNKVILAILLGGFFTGAPLWMVFGVPILNGGRIYVLGVALAGVVLGFLLGRSSRGKGGSRRDGTGGRWTMGRWGGESSGGGSSWGGGGSSGGGGASGSW